MIIAQDIATISIISTVLVDNTIIRIKGNNQGNTITTITNIVRIIHMTAIISIEQLKISLIDNTQNKAIRENIDKINIKTGPDIIIKMIHEKSTQINSLPRAKTTVTKNNMKVIKIKREGVLRKAKFLRVWMEINPRLTIMTAAIIRDPKVKNPTKKKWNKKMNPKKMEAKNSRRVVVILIVRIADKDFYLCIILSIVIYLLIWKFTKH